MNVRYSTLVLVLAVAGVFGGAALAWSGWTGMNHTTGTIAVLADGLRHGQAPGHAGPGWHLDTVYMPLFPAGIALLRLTGLPWLEALRAGSLLSFLSLLAATGWASRRAGGGWSAALLSMALVACAAPVHVASLAGRADLLAAALSLAALGAWVGERPARPWVVAVLAVLAVLTRITSVTVPLAVLGMALVRRDVRGAFRFGAQFALVLAAAVLLLVPIHGPQWLAAVIHQTVAAPLNTTLPMRGPLELLRYLGSYAELAVVAALALVALVAGGREGAGECPSLLPGVRSRLRAATGVSLLVALSVLSNRGADHNHLIELIAIACVAGATFGERLAGDARRLFAVLVLLAVTASSWRELAAVRREAANPLTGRADILALLRADRGEVLCEDALLALASGHHAAFADPASVRAVARAGFAGSGELEQDVVRQRWSMLVTLADVQAETDWYRNTHLGASLARAILTHYERAGVVDNFVVWRPREAPTPRAGR